MRMNIDTKKNIYFMSQPQSPNGYELENRLGRRRNHHCRIF